MKPYLVLTIVTIICTGCATMESEFKKACDDDTIAAYQRYLQKYPDSKFETDARNRVEELEWARTVDEKSVLGYETYLRKYPLGKYRDEAKRRLGDAKWKSIKANSDTTSRELYEAAKNYIEQQPTGAYVSEAQSTLKNYVTHSVGNVMETPELNKRQLKKTDSIILERVPVEPGALFDRWYQPKCLLRSVPTIAINSQKIEGEIRDAINWPENYQPPKSCPYTDDDKARILAEGMFYTKVPSSIGEGGGFRMIGKFWVDKCLNPLYGIWDGKKEGAIHTIIGNLTMFEYEFQSDEASPLVFRLTKNGYEYVEGKGVVIDLTTEKRYTFPR